MSAATRYRRSIVVDSGRVARNLALLRERFGSGSFSVWAERRSNKRFLDGFRALAEQFSIRIESGDSAPENEIRLNQILGGHPELSPAVALETHLFGIRTVAPGEGVSYGATFVAPTAMPVGLAPVGFADGIDRRLSGSLRVRVDGIEVPVIGRIAMDSMSLDLRAIPDAQTGAVVTIYGATSSGQWGVRESAKALDILPVEVITRLSERAEVEWR